MLSKRNTGKNESPVWYYDFLFRGNRYRGIGGNSRTQALCIQEMVRNRMISESNQKATVRKNLMKWGCA